MRFLLVLLAIVALLLLAALATGFVSIDQTQPAAVQAPKFEADVGRVDVGMENKTIQVPVIEVQKPGEPANAN